MIYYSLCSEEKTQKPFFYILLLALLEHLIFQERKISSDEITTKTFRFKRCIAIIQTSINFVLIEDITENDSFYNLVYV